MRIQLWLFRTRKLITVPPIINRPTNFARIWNRKVEPKITPVPCLEHLVLRFCNLRDRRSPKNCKRKNRERDFLDSRVRDNFISKFQKQSQLVKRSLAFGLSKTKFAVFEANHYYKITIANILTCWLCVGVFPIITIAHREKIFEMHGNPLSKSSAEIEGKLFAKARSEVRYWLRFLFPIY